MKFALLSVLITAIVFTVGFFSGYQQAVTNYTADSEVEILALPAAMVFPDSDIEPQLPATIAVGAEIDVDLPETGYTSRIINSFQDKQDESVTVKEPDFVVVTALTPAELNSIKYSIQVAVFAHLINAKNMVDNLQTQNLDAYVSDFINRENENRYNVRFGYFMDKGSATAALNKYKNKHKSDGYVVNFSVKNMTNLADAKDVTTTKKTKNILSPETKPSDAMSLETERNNVSQSVLIRGSEGV